MVLLNILMFFSFFFPVKNDVPQSIYDFKVASLNGGKINFRDFKGKKILIVNTASKCGYTGQYDGLQKMHEKYKDKLVIVGFPANNFGAQEPGTNNEIQEFCKKNYGVTFPMAAKISVKGDEVAPIYLWLTKKKYNGKKDSEVKWNFQKYLINEEGELVDVFMSDVAPDNAKLIAAIEG